MNMFACCNTRGWMRTLQRACCMLRPPPRCVALLPTKEQPSMTTGTEPLPGWTYIAPPACEAELLMNMRSRNCGAPPMTRTAEPEVPLQAVTVKPAEAAYHQPYL